MAWAAKLVAFLVGAWIASLITGCAGLGDLPTFQHCKEVNYNRAGSDITISAKCSAYGAW
jgi:hypothetical protein